MFPLLGGGVGGGGGIKTKLYLLATKSLNNEMLATSVQIQMRHTGIDFTCKTKTTYEQYQVHLTLKKAPKKAGGWGGASNDERAKRWGDIKKGETFNRSHILWHTLPMQCNHSDTTVQHNTHTLSHSHTQQFFSSENEPRHCDCCFVIV